MSATFTAQHRGCLCDALNPGGRIIVEDFRAEGGSERSARWFESLARELHASGKLSPEATVEALLDKARAIIRARPSTSIRPVRSPEHWASTRACHRGRRSLLLSLS